MTTRPALTREEWERLAGEIEPPIASKDTDMVSGRNIGTIAEFRALATPGMPERMRFTGEYQDEMYARALRTHAETLAAMCVTKDARIEMLEAVVTKVANHEWLICTAHDKTMGWQVNVRDGEPDEEGSQHYKPMRSSFGETPIVAALKALSTEAPNAE